MATDQAAEQGRNQTLWDEAAHGEGSILYPKEIATSSTFKWRVMKDGKTGRGSSFPAGVRGE